MSRPWFPQHSPDDYRDHGAGPSQPGYAQQLGEPRPGHGTVYLAKNRDGTWSGSWQDDYLAPDADGATAGVEDVDDLTERDAIDWATTRRASQVYVLVTTDSVIGGVRQTDAVPLSIWLSQHP